MKKLMTLFVIAFLCAGCRTVDNRPYRQVSFFTGAIDVSGPVESRIQGAPANVISWLNAMDSTDNYKPYTLTAEEEILFIRYLSLLPENYRQIVEEKVIVIYFIDNFTGGGMTCETFDTNGNMYMVWFYNTEILRRTLGEWINYRENSFFDDNENGIGIVAGCTGDYAALIHTLLHEASHVFDYYYHVTPFVEPGLHHRNTVLKTGFTETIWETYNLPVEKYDFPRRGELSAYGLGPAQRKSLAPDIYRSLSKTPFASVYGSRNWAEDFAEAFTWYYLGKYLNCSYRVSIINGEDDTFVYEPLLNSLLTDRFGYFE